MVQTVLPGSGAGSPHVLQKRALRRFICPQGQIFKDSVSCAPLADLIPAGGVTDEVPTGRAGASSVTVSLPAAVLEDGIAGRVRPGFFFWRSAVLNVPTPSSRRTSNETIVSASAFHENGVVAGTLLLLAGTGVVGLADSLLACVCA